MKVLAGQVAIVAGAGRGFGRSISLELAAEGAAVCLVSRNRAQLEEAAASIRHRGGSACHVVADLSRASGVQAAVECARKELGAPTIAVFAAAVPGPFGPLWLANPDAWWDAVTLHVRAPSLLLWHVLPEMIERRKGHIVLVSSRAGNGTHAFLSPYCVGKAAQTRLASVVDSETREFGVRVFAIDPGLAFTQIAKDTVDDPGAQRFLPDMVRRLSALGDKGSSESALRECARRCVELVSGRYDALGGRFLESDVDLDELLKQEQYADA